MKVIVTCGPSFEPIDEVRRITNFSTGELGILLANALAAAGHEVICFKGVGATCPLPLTGPRLVSFTTNEDLRARLIAEAARGENGAVFHAAALCDYKVRQATGNNEKPIASAKISSRQGLLTLVLEPLPKLITELRALFPNARIVGWKYELEGSREDAIAAGRRQMKEAGSDACVVNGTAFGPGFGLCEPGAALRPSADKDQLCEALAQWLSLAVQPAGEQRLARFPRRQFLLKESRAAISLDAVDTEAAQPRGAKFGVSTSFFGNVDVNTPQGTTMIQKKNLNGKLPLGCSVISSLAGEDRTAIAFASCQYSCIGPPNRWNAKDFPSSKGIATA